ncbi:ASCH domain-containing protein [Bacillus cereus]
MKGLIIRSPWIELILEGKKTWEIRGANTKIRGKIALIKSGSGMVFGTIDLIDSKKLSLEEYQQSESFHKVPAQNCLQEPYKYTHAWIFQNPTPLKEPIPYKHPMGAVIWVNLPDTL